jgi:hypothetical protein
MSAEVSLAAIISFAGFTSKQSGAWRGFLSHIFLRGNLTEQKTD